MHVVLKLIFQTKYLHLKLKGFSKNTKNSKNSIYDLRLKITYEKQYT